MLSCFVLDVLLNSDPESWSAICIAAAALVGIGVILRSYWQAANSYRGYAEKAFGMEQQADDAAANDSDQKALAGMKVDWAYLKSINPDVVAWIYMPGTAIDYPVVHTSDNIMYGHHMNDGSMFACLSKQLVDANEFNANRVFFVLTPTRNYRCKSFALVLTDGYDQIAQTSFATPADMVSYIQDKENRSVVQPAEGMPDAASIERLFTLSTCDYTESNGRALLFAEVVATAEPSTDA